MPWRRVYAEGGIMSKLSKCHIGGIMRAAYLPVRAWRNVMTVIEKASIAASDKERRLAGAVLVGAPIAQMAAARVQR